MFVIQQIFLNQLFKISLPCLVFDFLQDFFVCQMGLRFEPIEHAVQHIDVVVQPFGYRGIVHIAQGELEHIDGGFD